MSVAEHEEREDDGEQEPGEHLGDERGPVGDGAVGRTHEAVELGRHSFAHAVDIVAGDIERAVVDEPVLDVVDRLHECRADRIRFVGDRISHDGEHATENDEEAHHADQCGQRRTPSVSVQPARDRRESTCDEDGDDDREEHHSRLANEPQPGQRDDADDDEPPCVGGGPFKTFRDEARPFVENFVGRFGHVGSSRPGCSAACAVGSCPSATRVTVVLTDVANVVPWVCSEFASMRSVGSAGPCLMPHAYPERQDRKHRRDGDG